MRGLRCIFVRRMHVEIVGNRAIRHDSHIRDATRSTTAGTIYLKTLRGLHSPQSTAYHRKVANYVVVCCAMPGKDCYHNLPPRRARIHALGTMSQSPSCIIQDPQSGIVLHWALYRLAYLKVPNSSSTFHLRTNCCMRSKQVVVVLVVLVVVVVVVVL